MPATPESRTKDGSRLIASWQLFSKQFSRWAFRRYGRRFLSGIRAVLSRHRAGFEWKEIAASLHLSSSAAADSFWSEMKRTTSNRMPRQIGPDAIREPAADTSQIPNSKTSQ